MYWKNEIDEWEAKRKPTPLTKQALYERLVGFYAIHNPSKTDIDVSAQFGMMAGQYWIHSSLMRKYKASIFSAREIAVLEQEVDEYVYNWTLARAPLIIARRVYLNILHVFFLLLILCRRFLRTEAAGPLFFILLCFCFIIVLIDVYNKSGVEIIEGV